MPVRFLIADDYRAHQRLLANIILLLGAEWEFAEDGRSALQKAEKHEFDIILMDMQMPGLGGAAAADHLLEHWAHDPRRPRIVAVTGDNTEERRTLCRAIGMDGFIAKPFDSLPLGESLQQVMIRGHCWEEGPSARLLNRGALHRAVARDGDSAGMEKFESWAQSTPVALRGLLDDHSRERIEELRIYSKAYGFVGIDAALATAQETSQVSAVWLVETARTFRICLTAARESLGETETTAESLMVA
jgi:CheY-like chemotaxis protein